VGVRHLIGYGGGGGAGTSRLVGVTVTEMGSRAYTLEENLSEIKGPVPLYVKVR